MLANRAVPRDLPSRRLIDGPRRLQASAELDGPCLRCGRAIAAGEVYLDLRGDVVHAECGLYRPGRPGML
jgi:hypothetical protein